MRRKTSTVIALGILIAILTWPPLGQTGAAGAGALTVQAAQAGSASSGLLSGETDISGEGSLQLDLTYTEDGAEKKMEGGSVEIYLAAGVFVNDADCRYDVSSGRFSSVLGGAEIENMDSAELGRRNASLSAALEKACGNIRPDAEAPVKEGSVSFSNLKAGLYFVRQKEKSEGDRSVVPFLISVPDAKGSMNVAAKPKQGIVGETHGVTPETGGGGSSGGSNGGGVINSGGKLPQTGQLWWPVPVLALCGIALTLGGETVRKKASSKDQPGSMKS